MKGATPRRKCECCKELFTTLSGRTTSLGDTTRPHTNKMELSTLILDLSKLTPLHHCAIVVV